MPSAVQKLLKVTGVAVSISHCFSKLRSFSKHRLKIKIVWNRPLRLWDVESVFMSAHTDTNRTARAAAPEGFQWDQGGWFPLAALGLAASSFEVTLAKVAAHCKIIYFCHPYHSLHAAIEITACLLVLLNLTLGRSRKYLINAATQSV